MRLTVEVLDQKTLSWNILACHDDVGIDAAPEIVAILREGLPLAASVRWNWSRQPEVTSGPAVVRTPFGRRRAARR